MLKWEAHGNSLPKNFPLQAIFFFFYSEFWLIHIIQQINHSKTNMFVPKVLITTFFIKNVTFQSLFCIFWCNFFPLSLLTKVPLHSKRSSVFLKGLVVVTPYPVWKEFQRRIKIIIGIQYVTLISQQNQIWINYISQYKSDINQKCG